MKYILILITFLLISCGSTKNKQSSSIKKDTLSISNININTDIVDKTNIKNTTSVTKKDTITTNNSIITDETNISVSPTDSTKPTILEDSKGNKYIVTNGTININKKNKKETSQIKAGSITTNNTEHTDKSTKTDNSSAIINTENKGSSVENNKNKFKRNWNLFPLFLILVVGTIIYFKPFFKRIWGIVKLWFFKF